MLIDLAAPDLVPAKGRLVEQEDPLRNQNVVILSISFVVFGDRIRTGTSEGAGSRWMSSWMSIVDCKVSKKIGIDSVFELPHWSRSRMKNSASLGLFGRFCQLA